MSYSKLRLLYKAIIAQFLYSKNATISHTQQQTAAVIPFCTAITMQYNSHGYAMQFLYNEQISQNPRRVAHWLLSYGLQKELYS